MPLVSPEIGAERVYGACPVYDAEGKAQALYRKIHLFDVDLVDEQESYRESNSMYPGDEVVTVATRRRPYWPHDLLRPAFPGDVSAAR